MLTSIPHSTALNPQTLPPERRSFAQWLFYRYPPRQPPAEPPLESLRATLLEKLTGSHDAWSRSVKRFRALYWFCLTGIVVVPTCLASLKAYIPDFPFALLSVFVAILGSVQAVVKPSDKFRRDEEFRDECDFFLRQCRATQDPHQIHKLMEAFEMVERRFHQGQHPWPVPKRMHDDGSSTP